jgi:hypothetical protein
MASVTAKDRTWLVLLRDISHAVRIPDEPTIVASLVFDMGTAVVLASAVATSDAQALEQACTMALDRPAGGLAPLMPNRVLCNPGLARLLDNLLADLWRGATPQPAAEVEAVHEAEDIFDSFVGHLAGRRSPHEFAEPSDWQLFFEQALRFYRQQVWTRWADDVDLTIELGLGGDLRAFTAVVLGHEGIQHGVVLHPGDDPSPRFGSDRANAPPAMPAGTLMFNLDPPSDVPAEFSMKANRYGWPPEADLVPVFLTVDGREPGDPGRDDVRLLTVALGAIVEHDSGGPVLVERGPKVTEGGFSLADGGPASFRIRQLPRREEEDGEHLRVHLAGTDLLQAGTPLVIGSADAAGVTALRRDARVHRPLPAGSPRVAEGEVAMLIVISDETHGETIAGRIAALDPYGITIAEVDGHAVVALVGGGGAELLMELPAGEPALRRFRSRMKARRGVHALLVADDTAANATGQVYGFFEFYLPTEPPTRAGSVRSRARSTTPRKRR